MLIILNFLQKSFKTHDKLKQQNGIIKDKKSGQYQSSSFLRKTVFEYFFIFI